MNKWITSDQHFSHGRIIQYCNRPFSSVEAMNEALIANHNELVDEDDLVYHLGDFGMGDPDLLADILSRLDGFHILVRGNHDGTVSRCKRIGFDEVLNSLEFQLGSVEPGSKVVATHRPWDAEKILEDKTAYPRTNIVLHGHEHNQPSERYGTMRGYVNVCVENWDYRPILLSTAIEKGLQSLNA